MSYRARYLHDLLVRVLQCVISWIEASTVVDNAVGATLEEQATAISRGWRPTRSWARAVQAALYLADQLRVPLRSSESVRLELAERTHAPDFSTIEINMRAWKHRRRLHAFYHNGDPSAYPVIVYALYTMPGGARDVLLSDGSGKRRSSTRCYVPDAARTTSNKLDARALGRMLSWCLKCAAPALGMTEDEFRQQGLRSPSDIRRAVAMRLADSWSVVQVAYLLGVRAESAVTLHRNDIEFSQDLWRHERAPGAEGR